MRLGVVRLEFGGPLVAVPGLFDFALFLEHDPQVAARLRPGRAPGQACPQGGLGFCQLARLLEPQPQVVEGDDIGGIDLQRLPVGCDGRL